MGAEQRRPSVRKGPNAPRPSLPQTGVSSVLGQLGQRAETVSGIHRESAESVSRCLEAPLKEFVRMVKAVKKVVGDRSAALAAHAAARADVDARRGKLAKLRGTPGIREEKVAEAERDLHDAQCKADATRAAYEVIVQRMGTELARFQRERAQEMGYVLRDFALVEAEVAADSARVWRSLVPGLAVNEA